MPIIDENFKIEAQSDDVTGVLTKQENYDNKKIVIIAHGLGGYINQFMHKQASLLMPKCGYDVARINLYSHKYPLEKSSIAILVEKIRATVNHYRSKYEKIFLVGHSYGCINILEANLDGITAASLWEASFGIDKTVGALKLGEVGDYFYFDTFVVRPIMSKEFLDEVTSYTEEKCYKLSDEIKHPIQVVHGTESILYKNKKTYTDKCEVRNRYDVVEGANHIFWEGNTAFDLLDKTLDWFGEF